MYKPGKQNQVVDVLSCILPTNDNWHALYNKNTHNIFHMLLVTIIPELTLDACTTAVNESLTDNCTLLTLRYPHCSILHVDIGKWVFKKHIMHIYLFYTSIFNILVPVQGNLLANCRLTLHDRELFFARLLNWLIPTLIEPEAALYILKSIVVAPSFLFYLEIDYCDKLKV